MTGQPSIDEAEAGWQPCLMVRSLFFSAALLIAGCTPVAPDDGGYAPPPSQQPVRSAFYSVPAPAVSAEIESGRIDPGDYPAGARDRRSEGEVAVVLLVRRDGRVGDCRIDRTSGDRELDQTTCDLILDRFRYRPALDANRQPVEDEAGWVQRWSLAG